jgi:hypothetical protein
VMDEAGERSLPTHGLLKGRDMVKVASMSSRQR